MGTQAANVGRRARDAAPRAANSKGMNALARFGVAAKGVSYAIVGVIALKLALGDSGSAESREGALATLADEPLGEVLLLALAAGFAGYALWRLAQAVFDKEAEGDGPKGLAKRAGYVGRAVIYASLTFATLRIAWGAGGGGSQNGEARRAASTVFDWPAGRWLVLAVGLGVIGAGLFNGFRAVSRSFEDKWHKERMSDTTCAWGRRLGTGGLLARMVVFGLIGLFLAKAALEYDAKEAIGLDGALQKLAAQPYGSALLATAAVGLLAYAAFGLFEARYRRV